MSSAPPIDPELQSKVAGPVNAVMEQAHRLDRADLAEKIESSLGHLVRPTPFRIVVVGEIKRGKSSLINGVLGVPDLLPVDADVCTATQTTVEFAPEPRCEVVLVDGSTVATKLADLGDWTSVLGQAANEGEIHSARIGLPNRLLQRGAVIVDTPGINGPVRGHTERTRASLTGADVALFVLDGDTELTAPELHFAEEIVATGLTVLFVATKRDLPGSDAVVDRDRQLLATRAPHLATTTVHSVSNTVKAAADRAAVAAATDADHRAARELFELSGYSPLLAMLVHRVECRDVARALVALRVAESGAGQLLGEIQTKKAALADSDPDAIKGRAERRIRRIHQRSKRAREAMRQELKELHGRIDTAVRQDSEEIRAVCRDHIAAGRVRPELVRQEIESGLDALWTDTSNVLVGGVLTAVERSSALLDGEDLDGLLDDFRPTVALGDDRGPLQLPTASEPGSADQLLRYMPAIQAPFAVGNLLALLGATGAATAAASSIIGLPLVGAALLVRRSSDVRRTKHREATALVQYSLGQALNGPDGLRAQVSATTATTATELDELIARRVAERGRQITDEANRLLALWRDELDDRRATTRSLDEQARLIASARAHLTALTDGLGAALKGAP